MTTEDEGALVGVLDRAFAADSFLTALVSDPARRARAETALHRGCLRYASRFGEVQQAPHHAGVALWLPPGAEHMTLPRMCQTGVAQFGLSLGGALPRLLALDAAMTKMHRRYAPERHWYLLFLAVDPAAHGQGIGGTLLEQGVARAEAQGLPVYLETQTEANVRFYTKRGFVVQEQRAFSPELTLWGLKRG
jgi:ribosomal protein S18 acetylase RimI-like enzyme